MIINMPGLKYALNTRINLNVCGLVHLPRISIAKTAAVGIISVELPSVIKVRIDNRQNFKFVCQTNFTYRIKVDNTVALT